jgi:hypothetical protein
MLAHQIQGTVERYCGKVHDPRLILVRNGYFLEERPCYLVPVLLSILRSICLRITPDDLQDTCITATEISCKTRYSRSCASLDRHWY